MIVSSRAEVGLKVVSALPPVLSKRAKENPNFKRVVDRATEVNRKPARGIALVGDTRPSTLLRNANFASRQR